MADLIIKPSSGNSLVLQDEGGDAALTVGTTGSTTLAGTGNNLGTVTAGSIAGGSITSATTFPAGHVIQTTDNFTGSTQTVMGSAGDNVWTDTVVTGSITTSSATNAVIVHWDVTVYWNNTTSDSGFGFRVKRVANSVTEYPSSLSQHVSGSTHASQYEGSPQADAQDRWSASAIDDACGFAGVVTYTLQCAEYHAETLNVGGAGMNGRWNIWFQEVQK